MNIDWLKIFSEGLKEAAEEIMKIYSSDKRGVEISRGYGGDMTLIADKASEDIIIEKLRDIHTDIRVISEETGEVIIGKAPQYTVMLDPLDGSFNFKNGLLYFGISIAVLDINDSPIAACVLNVPQSIEYSASSEGAFKNGKKLQTENRGSNGSLLVEFSKLRSIEDMNFILETVMKMKKIRAPGAIALDLCNVAEGTFDSILSSGGSRYLDLAAGFFILEQAGGIVSDFKGNRNIREGVQLKTENIIASANRKIYETILG